MTARHLLLPILSLLLLLVPHRAAAANDDASRPPKPSQRIVAFYYPWYGNPATDGRYANWNHPVAVRNEPPRAYPGGEDIGANFYPALGAYSSNDPALLQQHMQQLRRAGVGVISVSWWGRDTFTDRALPKLFAAAEAAGILINFHLEPFPGRNANTTREAIAYLLAKFGTSPACQRLRSHQNRPVFFLYDSYLTPATEWATLLRTNGTHTLRGTSLDAVVLGLWVKEHEQSFMLEGGFDGFYTYFATDGFTYGSTAAHWLRLAEWAREHQLLFVPCVGPGYNDLRIRPWNAGNYRERENGAYYDRLWSAAVAAHADLVGITSFNEWHEGTQIEPATPKHIEGFTYEDYRPRPPEFYLDRTAHWARQLEPQPALGINLAGPADWNTELPFIDAFRLARAWISQKQGERWGGGPPLQLDRHGWVQRLEPQCFAETPLCTIDDGHYPSGEWTVLWEGEGELELSKGTVVSRTPGRLVAHIDAQGGGFFLRLRATDPSNPIRNIRALMPGFTFADALPNPWHPQFLARWRGVACLRFMDFQETNNSQQRQWSDRPLPTDATFTRAGVPIEWLCDLANRLGADPWFCLPHLADDTCIREFAQLVFARLDPQRRVYIEYSNEVWNSMFKQHHYAAEQGQKLGLATRPWEAAWLYTAHRSVEIFRIWEEVFGGRDRLVRVLPTQAANSTIARRMLGYKDTARHVDALAIAPYISMNLPPEGKSLTAAQVATWTPDRFLDYVQTNALPEAVCWIQEHRKVAEAHGLKLVAYEAGQHFVGVGGGENHEPLTQLLHTVNAHPRMATLYRDYYQAWEHHGGDLLCHFSSVGRWSKWGSWGLLQYYDDPPAQSPKFKATLEWARQRGQPVTVP